MGVLCFVTRQALTSLTLAGLGVLFKDKFGAKTCLKWFGTLLIAFVTADFLTNFPTVPLLVICSLVSTLVTVLILAKSDQILSPNRPKILTDHQRKWMKDCANIDVEKLIRKHKISPTTTALSKKEVSYIRPRILAAVPEDKQKFLTNESDISDNSWLTVKKRRFLPPNKPPRAQTLIKVPQVKIKRKRVNKTMESSLVSGSTTKSDKPKDKRTHVKKLGVQNVDPNESEFFANLPLEMRTQRIQKLVRTPTEHPKGQKKGQRCWNIPVSSDEYDPKDFLDSSEPSESFIDTFFKNQSRNLKSSWIVADKDDADVRGNPKLEAEEVRSELSDSNSSAEQHTSSSSLNFCRETAEKSTTADIFLNFYPNKDQDSECYSLDCVIGIAIFGLVFVLALIELLQNRIIQEFYFLLSSKNINQPDVFDVA